MAGYIRSKSEINKFCNTCIKAFILRYRYIKRTSSTNRTVMRVPALLLVLALIISAIGCSTTERASEHEESVFAESVELKQVRPDGAISDDRDYYRDLGDYLYRVPGVLISGNRVTIRGINSFQSEIEPLFRSRRKCSGQQLCTGQQFYQCTRY